ncbi:hypothetical protein CspHIS471_0309170 [Cutaneotrichosporon sp. HIS471]|nr:hypothetical protein CspHIS471_0309170 [Cutaneotrichosporon sp. HIS471]
MTAESSSTSSASTTQPLRTTKETHPNLPPGLILGEDGKPCKVCNSWQDWAKIKVVKKGASSSSSKDPMAMMAAMAGGAAIKKKEDKVEVDRSECPPDTGELGRATWTFLHTTAAYYPLKPNTEQQNRMRALLGSLPTLYPCTPCADDFGADTKANPPDVLGSTPG